MTLPLLLSVPHAGLEVAPEVAPFSILSEEDIARDGDEGAREIWCPLQRDAAGFVTTSIARAFVDQNRAEDDRRKDGVVKTHTCWDVPIYREPLPEPVVEKLLERHYRPYHRRLAEAAPGVRCGIDGHTMAAFGPPVGPDPGRERPALCLSHGDGTCPDAWIESLAACLQESFGRPVAINDPFRGGFITRHHARERPWIQVEVSRAPWISDAEKSRRLRHGLEAWCGMWFPETIPPA